MPSSSPHPGARQCSWKAIEIVKRAAEAAGAPAGIVDGVTQLTLEATSELMHSKDVSLILATGGEGMVRAACASGTPTISGGPGNGPAFIERSADIHQAVKDIITSKTFDNGVICASEQSIIVERCIYDEVHRELAAQGAYFMNEDEAAKMAALLLRPNGTINPKVVGKTALHLSQLAGFSVPSTRVLVAEQTTVSHSNPYSREKLCPVLGLYVEEEWRAACHRVVELLTNEGLGHTLVIHTRNQDVIRQFSLEKPVNRILINTPSPRRHRCHHQPHAGTDPRLRRRRRRLQLRQRRPDEPAQHPQGGLRRAHHRRVARPHPAGCSAAHLRRPGSAPALQHPRRCPLQCPSASLPQHRRPLCRRQRRGRRRDQRAERGAGHPSGA